MSCRRRLAVTLIFATLIAPGCEQPEGHDGAGGGPGGAGVAGSGGAGGRGTGTGGSGGGAGSGGAAGVGGVGGAGGGTPDAAAADGTPAPDGATAAPGCSADAPMSLLCDPLRKMPRTIRETGLFPAAPDFSKHAPGMRKYAPDPPLWSDGLEKERFLLLPAGQKIDNRNPNWVFPVGTVFIKTFFDDGAAGGKPRPVETRFIRRVGTETDFVEYDYYLYQWNAEGTDATLVIDDRNGDDQFAPTVKVIVNHMADGKPLVINNGQPFDHTLPSRSMCADCHRQNGVAFQTFIGFDELRLNAKLTPAAARTQLEELRAAGIFTTTPAPGAPPPRSIVDSDPTLLKVKRFVFGNCVHCHNDKGMVFDLSPDKLVMNTVNQKTEAQSVQPPRNWLRVVPGVPEMSVLFVQARRTPLPMPTTAGGNRLRPMPPIGVNDIAADQEGVAALKTWIMSLPK
jgi:hypothetical protein